MKFILCILNSLIFIILFSCKKKEIVNTPPKNILDTIKSSDTITKIDTIFPKSYYPIYPKSWWKYKINDSIYKTSYASETYQLNSYRTSYDFEKPVFSKPYYVPFLDNKPIYGYSKIEWVKPPFGNYYTKWSIIREIVGFKYTRSWEDTRYGNFNEYLEVKNKFFNGKDSILVLEGNWVYGSSVNNKSYEEYAKGIGLIKSYIIDTLKNDTLYKKVLIDYYINYL